MHRKDQKVRNPLARVSAGLTLIPIVTIGGVRATNVIYSGLAPGLVGLYQINVQVPE